MSDAVYKHFQTITRPVVTEKSYAGMQNNNQYVFRVAKTATKQQIREAVESVFEVKVERVQVINVPGKKKQRGARRGWRTGYRKAIVRLPEGQNLEVMEEAS
ncbi:MAG: 50S ribosomal protein L23 [Mariprofundales bacterium]